jgi:hypothetical protein
MEGADIIKYAQIWKEHYSNTQQTQTKAAKAWSAMSRPETETKLPYQTN